VTNGHMDEFCHQFGSGRLVPYMNLRPRQPSLITTGAAFYGALSSAGTASSRLAASPRLCNASDVGRLTANRLIIPAKKLIAT
jgi:hypothetical protein